MSGCRHRRRYVMFFGQRVKGWLSDGAGGQQNKSTVSGTGAPESARMYHRDNRGRVWLSALIICSPRTKERKTTPSIKIIQLQIKSFLFCFFKKNYIQTLNTSLPHHIAQILKWQYYTGPLCSIFVHTQTVNCALKRDKLHSSHATRRQVKGKARRMLFGITLE